MRNFLTITVFATLATQVSVYCSTFSDEFDGDSRKSYSNNLNNRSAPSMSFIYTSERPLLRVSAKKWQVGRVSRKHYEIVNMLWRKTTLFIDSDMTTEESRFRRNNPSSTQSKKEPYAFTPLRFNPQTTTPSYIEFYYLDDNDERVKRRDTFTPNTSSRRAQQIPFMNDKNANLKHVALHYPILSFYVNDPELQFAPPPPTKSYSPKVYEKTNSLKKKISDKKAIYDFLLRLKTVKTNHNRDVNKMPVTLKSMSDETCLSTYQATEDNVTFMPAETHTVRREVTPSASTKAYDKIKFFEMYDKHTHLPNDENDEQSNVFNSYAENLVKHNHDDKNKKVLLEDVDKNIGHQDGLNQKNVKKHANYDFTKEISSDLNNLKIVKDVNFKPVTFHKNKTQENYNTGNQKSIHKASYFIAGKEEFQNYTFAPARNASRSASWADYPFVAVYVYEPSQLHCDAAALSPHWLIAAGACLSRYHRKDPMTEGRTAFVAYCGQNWWHPERVSYVKYSVVHPRYHPKDKLRRYLYNIGLVKVVGSMASACFGWRPISLMSHHFASDTDGSIASAVGWGLDRYDVRYSRTDLPKEPLSVYEELIFSTSCPGNAGYSKMKLEDEEEVTKNVYCLLLSPYNGETNDPVHGSLLLVGGKLIALYIQNDGIDFDFPLDLKEERRPWGVQSAQYTGIWRLVPWVHEVAREADDGDSFGIEI